MTAADFVATADNTDEYVRAAVTNGTFSIETDGNVKYLVYTLNKKAVYSNGVDGYNDHSFTAGTHWDDSKPPHSDADYFIKSGHQIRSVRGASSKFDCRKRLYTLPLSESGGHDSWRTCRRTQPARQQHGLHG